MEFRLADLGEGMAEAEIVRWLVPEGGRVAEDEPLVEVETDKALVQIPSPAAGVVARHGAAEGQRVPVGGILAVIETGGAAGGAGAPSHGAAGGDSSPSPVGEGAPAARGAHGDDAQGADASRDAGAIVGNLDNAGALSVEEPEPSPGPRAGGRATASPATRRLARDLGIDLASVRGSGPEGRVTADDVRAAAAALATPASTRSPAAPPLPVAAGPAVDGVIRGRGIALPAAFGERIPLRGLRHRIAEHMAAAHRTVPQVTVVEEADVTDLVHLRERLNEGAGAEGGAARARVSYLPFFAAAAMRALAAHPILNSSLDEARGEIVIHPHIHLGIAVDTKDGLMVAVLPEAERLSVQDLARELPPLAEAARQRTLPPERLRGSTFTITSAGSVGGLFATPIVNHPEVAILGIHRIVERPGIRDGRVEARRMMHVSLSFDHRVLDGAEASRYLMDVKALIENPFRLLWE